LSETISPNDRFSKLGYKSTNFLEVSGLVIQGVMSAILTMIIYTLFKRTSKKHFKVEMVRKLASYVPDKNVSEGLVT
jgi:hypothetical protein